jgi:4-hydroxyacetophenone monooxygenase
MSARLVEADQTTLAEKIAQAERRTLAAVLTYLSKDANLITDPRDKERLRSIAMEVLPDFIGKGDPTEPRSDEVLQAAINLAFGERVSERYRPLVRDQMGFPPLPVPDPLAAPPGFRVAIIGGGVTGLAVAMRLHNVGFENFTVLDRNEGLGGTWWENRYPGCRVDTPSAVYSYSSHLEQQWPDHFSYQPVIREYLESVADRFRDKIRTAAEVTEMVWLEQTREWELRGVERGKPFTIRANVVVGATGFLSIPSIPSIPGAESFHGPMFHSKEWPGDAPISGRRVAVIGTGASANQIVPAIAGNASEVFVYQRSPHWIMSHPFYGRRIEGVERWLFDNIPTYKRWFRVVQFWLIGDRNLALQRIDSDWPHQDRSVNRRNDELRVTLTDYIEKQIGDMPSLLEQVLPDFPPYAKRMVLDNGFYQALRRDNVHLITSPIVEITATGIRTQDGYDDIDVVVFATGFQTNRILYPIEIIGAGGCRMRERLDSSPEAYLGLAFANCPNLFVTTGPNGVQVHGGAITFLAECQAHFIGECLRHMFRYESTRIEIDHAALRRFVEDMRVENAKYVWATKGVETWFNGSVGSTSVVLPWSNVRLWEESRSPDMSVFNLG